MMVGNQEDMIRQNKRRTFENLLQLGRIFLTLDTRVPGVKVPSEHQGKAALTLLFGRDLPIALNDLEVDDERIAVTLSFNRESHHCVIPWDSVWFIVPKGERNGVIFEMSLPDEAREQIQKQNNTLRPLDLDGYLDGKKRNKQLSRFQVIDGSLKTEERSDGGEEPDRRPTLTVVKDDDSC